MSSCGQQSSSCAESAFNQKSFCRVGINREQLSNQYKNFVLTFMWIYTLSRTFNFCPKRFFPNWKAGFFYNFSRIFFMIFPWFFMIFPGFFGDFPPDFSMIFPRIFVPDFFLMIFFPRFFDDFFLGFFSKHFLVGNEFSDKIIGFWTVFFFSYY